jgi:hypothetical protein
MKEKFFKSSNFIEKNKKIEEEYYSFEDVKILTN